MLYDASDRDSLRAWLVKTLEPICDAEPAALATYILALLDHDAPEQELRQEFVKQLEEFLENRDVTSTFVDTLFAALRSKSYVPYSTAPALRTGTSTSNGDAGIPIPLEGLLGSNSSERGTKRGLEDGESDYRNGPPPKGPRISGENRFARFSDTSLAGQDWRGNGQNNFNTAGDAMGMMNGYNGRGQHSKFSNNPSGWVDLPRGVCRDYHIKGYCARGHMCKYSHDDAAFAPAQMMFPGLAGPMGMAGPGIPMLPIFPGAMPFGMDIGNGGAYDPHESQLDMRSTSLSRTDTGSQIGSVVLDDAQVGSSSQNTQPLSTTGRSSGETASTETPSTNQNGQISTSAPIRPTRGGNANYRGSRGGRGTFSGDHQSFRSDLQNRDGKTLVVEKIPEEHLTLEAVNNWFKRFGTVTNVAVDKHSAKALVSFASHDEAHAAWKTQEAIFNNRFVKIFWHKPLEGQGGVGARMLQASASVVANLGTKEAPSPPTAQKPATNVTKTQTTSTNTVKSTLAAKQQQLEKKIAEQKELMAKLATASPEEKKEIMARLRKLDEPSSTTVKEATPSSSHQPDPPNAAEDKERRAKELLDMELELHATKTSPEDSPSSSKQAEAESTADLQEKLAKLQAEAAALGISADNTNEPVAHAPTYYPRGRGRGRGRPYYRGGMRGGPPRGSMKLDNRPKSLAIKGLEAQNAGVVQAVRSWYELGGQMSNLVVQEDDSIIVQFRSRSAAEAAFAKGTTIPDAGTATISWHQDNATVPNPPVALPSDNHKVSLDRPASPPRHEEVVEDPGWGDEDGMGTF